jgi:hypothetical protein
MPHLSHYSIVSWSSWRLPLLSSSARPVATAAITAVPSAIYSSSNSSSNSSVLLMPQLRLL